MNKKVKFLLFDATFFTYSAALAIHWGILIIYPALAQEELFVRYLGEVALGLFALWLMALLTAHFAAREGIATLGMLLFAPERRRQELAPEPALKSFWGIHLLIAFILTLAVSLKTTEFSFAELSNPEGFAGALRLYHGITHANLTILPTAITQIVETIFTAFLATTLAVPVAFVLSFLCAKNIMSHPVAAFAYAFLRLILNITRSVEPLIWALIFTVWVGIGPFAGMLALMIHSVASLTKQYSEIVEDVAAGPIEAIRATGASPIQIIWFAVVPQIVLPYVAFTIYRWDTNVRMATVIGLVGGGGIGTLLIQYQGQAMWPEVGTILFVIAVAVWIMDVASAYIREALR